MWKVFRIPYETPAAYMLHDMEPSQTHARIPSVSFRQSSAPRLCLPKLLI